MSKPVPSTAPIAARPRADLAGEAGGSPVANLQERVVQAAFAELQAQNKLMSARAANLAQEVATLTIRLELAQAELTDARTALEQAQSDG